MLPTPDRKTLDEITRGDFADNQEVDTACAKRLLLLCRDYGKEGEEAEQLLRMALNKIEVFA